MGSKAGKGKRKALEDSVSASSVKKAKVENEATTSSMSRSSSVRGRGAASPSKTSGGGKGSPKMEIPKFSLDAADDSTTDSEVEVEKSKPKSRGGSKRKEEVVGIEEEHAEQEVTVELAPRGRRGTAKKTTPVLKSTRSKRGQKTQTEESQPEEDL